MNTIHTSDLWRSRRPLPQLAARPFIVRRPNVRVYSLARTTKQRRGAERETGEMS